MVETHITDLFGLDRDVARAANALARWRSAVAVDASEGESDPFDELRRVTGKTTWDELGSLATSVADEPLRAGLRRWVLSLVRARLALVDDAAWAREIDVAQGHFEGERARLMSWREAWRGVVLAKKPAEVERWLDAAADVAPRLAPIQRHRAARQIEVARRLGLVHPWDEVAPASVAALRVSAVRVLDATEDLAQSVWRETRRDASKESARGMAGVGVALHAVVARDAPDGWPARLTPRWLEETFRDGTRGLALDLPALPEAAGAASFARALGLFGYAVRVASAPASMPFVLARDPAFVGAHRFAFVFGALGGDPVFQTRALGVGRSVADAQARVLARTALFEARLGAARILWGDPAADVRAGFEEMGIRLFGAPLDGRFSGVWPRARDDEPARWLALLETPALRQSLRERYDSDWFRNPHAWEHLRSQGVERVAAPAGKANVDADAKVDALAAEGAALGAGADALARAFEDALG